MCFCHSGHVFYSKGNSYMAKYKELCTISRVPGLLDHPFDKERC